ncbi:helix-hairpin-helix domain-containing protein [Salinisphaera sp. Q1T1-3]|uniref:ComEA family DNA-binding protein n=1 Tax=Salinisphaera sp. Q1T1-3 TaxID=2321229 RepID=UPI000E70F0F2|nr:helix-hairpin-helix domain-containing protein [Salinisphaera sp. Q1T1-3]RJS92534.1 competence protein ComE [Salinisphaera sp. Q1T1-3]
MRIFLTALAFAGLFYAGSALAAVNVNTASADTLSQLNGIGTVKAAAIVADRKANGDYDSLDQLTRVDGIGNKTVAALQDEATVGDADDNDSDDGTRDSDAQ